MSIYHCSEVREHPLKDDFTGTEFKNGILHVASELLAKVFFIIIIYNISLLCPKQLIFFTLSELLEERHSFN